jgi:cobaltochelatase CobS
MGTYAEAAMYKAYKDGGLYLLDEVDAGNANVLTTLNALLANGHYMFPNGELVTRHADFVVIAAGNTYGTGATKEYVGRNEMDGATRDRFAIMDFGYDEALEEAITGNTEWCMNVQRYRKAAAALSVKHIISPRASVKGAIMLKAGMKWSRVEETLVWKGLDVNTVSKIKAKAADC